MPARRKTATARDNRSRSSAITSPTATFLDNLKGNVAVNGDAGTDTLTINDQFNPFNDTYSIGAQGLAPRMFAGGISYNAVENVTFNAGAGNNILQIQQIPAGTTLTVHAGAGNDTVQVSSGANYLDNLRGPLIVSGDTGDDSLILNDQANEFNDTYLLTATTVSRPFAAPVTFDTFDQVTLNSGDGNGTFTVQSTAAGTDLTLNTGAGNDTVTLGSTGNNQGSVNSNITFVAVENLTGGADRDTFLFSNGRAVSGRINGGGGSDTLNYAAYTTAVTVNLATGSATGVGGGVTGIENVTGGAANDVVRDNAADNVLIGNSGNDLLLGGAGNDWLEGGSGRDFLLGGLASVDHLEGGADEDILINGTTTNEANDAALLAILAEWTRSDLTYEQRVTNLRLTLNPSTVLNDTTPDELFGGSGLDWFWASALDRIDQVAGEVVN